MFLDCGVPLHGETENDCKEQKVGALGEGEAHEGISGGKCLQILRMMNLCSGRLRPVNVHTSPHDVLTLGFSDRIESIE